MASVMQQLMVEATGVKLTASDEGDVDRTLLGRGRQRLSRRLDRGSSRGRTGSVAETSLSGENPSGSQQAPDALLLSFGRVHVHESRNTPAVATTEARCVATTR